RLIIATAHGCRIDLPIDPTQVETLPVLLMNNDKLEVKPANASRYVWLKDGSEIDVTTAAFKHIHSSGLYSVLVHYSDNCTRLSNTVDVQLDEISISPNPARDIVVIRIDHAKRRRYQLDIYSGEGALFSHHTVFHPETQFSLSHLPPGLYYFVMWDESGFV